MKLHSSKKFEEMLACAPPNVQEAFYKQARFLARNLRHPSLRAKKYDESSDIWQARVTGNWRFYFTIEADEYRLRVIKKHPK